VLFALLLGACQQNPANNEQPVDMNQEARRIANTNIIIDTHIDVPMKALQTNADLNSASRRIRL
jgi:hypothetical protein